MNFELSLEKLFIECVDKVVFVFVFIPWLTKKAFALIQSGESGISARHACVAVDEFAAINGRIF